MVEDATVMQNTVLLSGTGGTGSLDVCFPSFAFFMNHVLMKIDLLKLTFLYVALNYFE
uniref:Uncharacterized protein n=1 Tax=Anguilla anguilla TaxID=7936 RepID=A0A0E9XW18_ANGAN